MKEFYQGKKVFITGHTGFKGAWLSLWLTRLGAEVTGYALAPPTEPNLFDLCRLGAGMTSVLGDVRQEEKLDHELSAAEPDIVFHLAAQPLVRESFRLPVRTFHTNVMGTVNLLAAVRNAKSVKAVVVVTSDKVYENKNWPWGYRESDRLGGDDPYSASKACAEMVTDAYRASFLNSSFLGVGTARAGNVIGGGDWAAYRLVPDCMRAWLAGVPVEILHPDFVRPWQHVLEPLAGYLLLAERLYRNADKYSGPWNFGPLAESEQPVEWIADRLKQNVGLEYVIHLDARGEMETPQLRLDSSAARNILGWRPKWDIETALDKTAEWFLAYRDGKDAREVCLRQIEEYMEQGDRVAVNAREHGSLGPKKEKS